MQFRMVSIRLVPAMALALCLGGVTAGFVQAATPAATPGAAPADPLAAPHGAPHAAARAAAQAPDPLVAFFVWWNAAYKQKDGFTEQEWSKHVTPDVVMRINGSDRSQGVADIARHFRDIQAKTQMVEIELPFIDEFTSVKGDQIFTHHIVKARENGKDSRDRVMGYATIRDGKISLINFVSIPDPEKPAVADKK